MTAQDVLNAAKGKAAPFEFDGETYHLRPLSFGERREVFAWHEQGKAGDGLQVWLVQSCLCDAFGRSIPLSASEVDGFDVRLVDAIAKEILRRAGLVGDAGKV